tara:strand:+ start:169 stop:366 length:198 start_codon:yes stop_codon:yes gene_type:complete
MCVPRSGKVKRAKIEKRTKFKVTKTLINQVKYRNLVYESTSAKSKEEIQAAMITRKFDPHHALGC